MLRSLIVPAIILGVVAFPFFVPMNPQQPNARPVAVPLGSLDFQAANGAIDPGNYSQLAEHNGVVSRSPFRLAAARANGMADANGRQVVRTSSMLPQGGNALGLPPAAVGYSTVGSNNGSWSGPILDENGNVVGMVPGPMMGANFAGGSGQGGLAMVPDYGAAQTFTLPGDAAGPDFSAPPMQFTPVMNFAEIFNYRVTSNWLQGRWSRVSNSPAAEGLRGQRVALVTGTNTWDLHGSLTYYFDEYQKCRRITFRGWVGDPARLVDFLKQDHGFKQQPTAWAGFFLAKNWRKTVGGLLMKNPPVTYVENRVQRVGVLLELNDPNGKFELSDDFAALIDGSK